jgi:hypothetical protein
MAGSWAHQRASCYTAHQVAGKPCSPKVLLHFLFFPPLLTRGSLALAKESNATFINIAVSVLTNKWYGESNKLVAGLFSLARKMQPAIIFIDEIDSFLGERGRGDHEVTGMMKAEFMTYVFRVGFSNFLLLKAGQIMGWACFGREYPDFGLGSDQQAK